MAVVRAMTISYGATTFPGTVGGATVHLHGVHRIERDAKAGEARVEFALVVDANGSPATLATACAQLEALFDTRRQALVVAVGGNEILRLDDANNTGLDVSASLRKPGEEGPEGRYDTNTSRLYEVEVTAGLPADAGVGRLRDFRYRVSFSPSRRGRLELEGSYTATPNGNGARATYLASIDGEVTTITALLGGTWELVSESYTPDDADGICDFARVYEQILANQAQGTLDSPALVSPVLAITVMDGEPQGAEDGEPLLALRAEYETGVDFSVQPDLEAAWRDVSLPLIAEQLASFAGAAVAITRAEPRYEVHEHRLAATVEAVAIQGAGLLSRTVETVDDVDFGRVVREVWPLSQEIPADEDTDSPAPTPAHVGQGPRRITRRIRTTTRRAAGGAVGAPVAPRNVRALANEPGVRNGLVGGARFRSVLMRRVTDTSTETRGVRDVGARLRVTTRVVEEEYRIVVLLQGA